MCRYQLLRFYVDVIEETEAPTQFLLEPGGTYRQGQPLVFILGLESGVKSSTTKFSLKTTALLQAGSSSTHYENSVAPCSLYRVEGLASGDYQFSLESDGGHELARRVITVNRESTHVQ